MCFIMSSESASCMMILFYDVNLVSSSVSFYFKHFSLSFPSISHSSSKRYISFYFSLQAQNPSFPQIFPTTHGSYPAHRLYFGFCSDFYCSFGLVSAVVICCCNLCFYFRGHLLMQSILPLCPVDTFVLLLCHIH